ncbi:alpha/beta fold hydrolase [Promicromonospora xylanilytica]
MTDNTAWSPTAYARNRDVEIAYDRFGEPGGVPLLLVMGLAMSRFWWPDGLCQALADQGFDVVRYDQRDAGESTRFGRVERRSQWAALLRGSTVAYTSEDMVDDGVAVLDAVGWERAVVFGASMGGVVAQRLALRHPDRVLAVVSNGAPPSDASGLGVLRYLRFRLLAKFATMRFPEGQEGDIAASLAVARGIASPASPFDEDEARARIERELGSGPRDSDAQSRQIGAKWHGPRLRDVRVPVLALHGKDDPIIRTSAARAVAREIPGARVLVLPGVGHDLPSVAWRTVAAEVRALIADEARRGRRAG